VVVDDERAIRRLLRLTLETEGYVVHEAETGRGGIAEVVQRRPDVVILDLALPDVDGLEVLRRLREWSRVPVLVLSVRQDSQDKVAALDAGADDYLTKPFYTDELTARLRVLRRHSDGKIADARFVSGSLDVDFSARQVWLEGKEVHLSATEYALLRVLILHAGKVVTHRQLLLDVWGPNAGDQSQYLRVYVNHLRKKLHTDAASSRIRTETGIGYRFVPAEP
jgi:two-component system KDP operon response regulator KdpE